MPIDPQRAHYIGGWNEAVCEVRRMVGLSSGPPAELEAFLRMKQGEFIGACAQAFDKLLAAGAPRLLFHYFCECALTHHRTQPEHFWPNWGPRVGPTGPPGIGYYWTVYEPWTPATGPWEGWSGYDPPCAFAGLWPVLGLAKMYRYEMADGSTRTATDLLADAIKQQLNMTVTWLIAPNEVPWAVHPGKESRFAKQLRKQGLAVHRIEPGRVITVTMNPVPEPVFQMPDTDPPRPYACAVDLKAATGTLEPRLPKVQFETAWADNEDRRLAQGWEDVAQFIVRHTELGHGAVPPETGRPRGSQDILPPAPGQTRWDWIQETYRRLLAEKGSAAASFKVRQQVYEKVRDRAKRERFTGGPGDPPAPGWWRQG